MSFRTILAWTRMIMTAILVIAVVLIIFMNRNYTTPIWFFHKFDQVSVLWLIVVTAVISIISRWVIVGVYRAWKELKEAWAKDAMDEMLRKQKAEAKEEPKTDEESTRS
jgi:Mn2+/Fe2+ NRAMP family transporter